MPPNDLHHEIQRVHSRLDDLFNLINGEGIDDPGIRGVTQSNRERIVVLEKAHEEQKREKDATRATVRQLLIASYSALLISIGAAVRDFLGRK